MKKFLFALIMLALLAGAIEGSARVGLWWLETSREIVYDPLEFQDMPSYQRDAIDRLTNDKTRTTEYSQSLGWQPKQNVHVSSGRFITNSIRIRHDREFSPQPPADKIRISTFGDSFTAGIGVANSETWQERMMAENGDLEVLNFGVGGYGPDQAYLRFQENPLSQQIVIMGYLTENLHRVVNVYVPFYAGRNAHMPVTKPRFVVENDKLSLIENPIREKQGYNRLLTDYKAALMEYGTHDYYYQERYLAGPLDFLASVKIAKMGLALLNKVPMYDRRGEYNTESDAYRVTTRLFENFREQVLDQGALPVIVVFPTYPNIVHKVKHNVKKYRPLIDWLESNNFVYIDLLEGLLERKGKARIIDLFLKDLHYSPLGHELTAKTLLDFIGQERLINAKARQKLIDAQTY